MVKNKINKIEMDNIKGEFLKELVASYIKWAPISDAYSDAFLTLINAFSTTDKTE